MAGERYVTFHRFMDCKERPSIVRMLRQKGQLLHLLARLRLNWGIREYESTQLRLAGSRLTATGVQSPVLTLIKPRSRRGIRSLLHVTESPRMLPNWRHFYARTTLGSLRD